MRLAIAILLVTTTTAFAQDREPVLIDDMPATAVSQTKEEPRVIDGPFLIWSGALVLSSGLDAWSTRKGLNECSTCREVNPIAAPFVQTDVGAYGFALVTDAALIWVSNRLKQRGYRWRWPLILGTVVHTGAFISNTQHFGKDKR